MSRRLDGVCWGFIPVALLAQSAASDRPFEVASIRPHQGPMRTLDARISGPRLSWEAANLRGLIMFAYNLKNYQIAGNVPLLTVGDERFSLEAKAEGGSPRTMEEFRQMMQLLLVDRFKLQMHREMHEIPVYALVVPKNGPKLKPSAPDADPTFHYGGSGRSTVVTMPKADMADVLDAISHSMLDRPVLDKTGLTGTYDVRLVFTPDTRANRASEPDPNDISILTAVQEQLGLKLKPQKALIEVLVVDRAEKPTEN
jgi:bla regulator protein blaR1